MAQKDMVMEDVKSYRLFWFFSMLFLGVFGSMLFDETSRFQFIVLVVLSMCSLFLGGYFYWKMKNSIKRLKEL